MRQPVRSEEVPSAEAEGIGDPGAYLTAWIFP